VRRSATSSPAAYSQFFTGCHDITHIDNGLGINNGEQRAPVTVCTGLHLPWTVMWPQLRTIS